jgi:thioredoxin reductase
VSQDDLLAATLAGIAMVPGAYRRFDEQMGNLFTNTAKLNYKPGMTVQEVVIGGGFHAAVYAAVRHQAGYEKPYVLDPGQPGGAFAVTRNPSFLLNSESTAGLPGQPWEEDANTLNWLPGAPVQPAAISGRELPDNTVMRFVIRATLAMHARTLRGTAIRVTQSGGVQVVEMESGQTFYAGRVIDARGMGPSAPILPTPDGQRLLTWEQAMGQMDTDFPFAGMTKVAVLGGGKSALCAAEALLGIGPNATWRSVADGIPQVDLYAQNLPLNRDGWLATVERRYARLASHLPAGYIAFHDLTVRSEFGQVAMVPGGVMVNGRFYTHAVVCAGHVRPQPLSTGVLFTFSLGRTIARKYDEQEHYQVGPVAQLDWDNGESRRTDDNLVAMYRLAPRTAALAASLI